MSLFENSIENAHAALEHWTDVIAFLQGAEGAGGEKFNQEEDVPGTGQKLDWFDARVNAVCNLLKSLERVKVDANTAIPLAFTDQLDQASQQFKDTMLQAKKSVEQAKDHGITSLNSSTWEIIITQTNANLNLASHLQNIRFETETLLTAFYQIAPIVGAGKFDAFAEAVREISEKTKSVQKSAAAVSKARKTAEGDVSETAKQKDQAKKDNSMLSNILATARETLTKIEDANQSSQSGLAQVSEISSEANSLKSQVNGYETQFQAFQQSLDGRNATFEKWSKNAKALFAEFGKYEEQIGDTIERANKMLAGATNAGLAKTFNETLSDLDEKLKSARLAFYVSIGILFLSATPPAFLLFHASGLINAIWENFPEFKGDTLTIVSFSVLIAIPAIWLTKFSAASHHQLFQLKEHYQYKYSLAMAVDAFKKQAPDHADAIAAETFNQLLFNPADRLEGKGAPDDLPSPLMNWLMNKLGFNAKGEEE